MQINSNDPTWVLEVSFSCSGFATGFIEQDILVNEWAIAPFLSQAQGPVRSSLCNIQVYLRSLKREKMRRVTGYMIQSHFNLSRCMWSILSEQRDNTHFLFITRIQNTLYTQVLSSHILK